MASNFARIVLGCRITQKFWHVTLLLCRLVSVKHLDADFQNPSALAVLTDAQLLVVDLETPGYPMITCDHAMDAHFSPVTCLKYVSDTNTTLIPKLYRAANMPSAGSSKKVKLNCARARACVCVAIIGAYYYLVSACYEHLALCF